MAAVAVAIGLIMVIVFIGALVASVQKATRERLSKLERIASELLAGSHDGSSKATGSKLGPRITYEFGTRGSGSSAENWTLVHAEIPAAYPLAIHVRRHHRSDRRIIDRGDMVDVVVGDPAFDDAFLVEAAPADVVRELLSPELRGLLMATSEVDLETAHAANGSKELVLGVRGWLEELAAAEPLIHAMAHVAARVRTAYAAAEAADANPTSGTPYRQEETADPGRAAQAAREAEVGKIGEVRAKRAADATALAVILLILFLFIGSMITCGALVR